jgi:shikimate kinase
VNDHDHRPIALVGLMGAGKTAVARQLGERLGTSVADLDALIEAEEGLTIAALFERSGEGWFRRREHEALDRVLAAGAGVIACGGGIVLEPEGRDRLERRCRVVWLEVTPAEAARRIGADGRTRPLLAGAEPRTTLERLLAERAALYASVALWRITTDGRTASEVADEIVKRIGSAKP